uniref:hypothetical protein n=1 Tax=Burkholderia multivorans TaxID=87883 RepID=UPI0011B26E95|nr:hypothetical protein [Burkholderia multivorans]
MRIAANLLLLAVDAAYTRRHSAAFSYRQQIILRAPHCSAAAALRSRSTKRSTTISLTDTDTIRKPSYDARRLGQQRFGADQAVCSCADFSAKPLPTQATRGVTDFL